MLSQRTIISLKNLIGKGYKKFWEYRGRYLAVKGGRASKKSTTTSFKIPYKMMEWYHNYGFTANALVVRRFYNTHKDSTFAQLRWAINRMGVAHLWKVTQSPLQLTYIPSGGKILFRGFDDADSITSITVEKGAMCFCWIEECYQITSEDDFNKLDMSLRGELPEGVYRQFIMTMNP